MGQTVEHRLKAARESIAKPIIFGKRAVMNDDTNIRALTLLGEAITGLENALAERSKREARQELQIARKHAALRAEVTQTLKDIDRLIDEVQHG